MADQFCSKDSISHCENSAQKGELDNIGSENRKFLKKTLTCYEEAATKCDSVVSLAKTCFFQAVGAKKCSPSSMSYITKKGKQAFKIRNAMGQSINQLKQAINSNQKFIAKRNEFGQLTMESLEKIEPVDPFGIRKSVKRVFPKVFAKAMLAVNRISNTVRKGLQATGIMGSSGYEAPKYDDEFDTDYDAPEEGQARSMASGGSLNGASPHNMAAGGGQMNGNDLPADFKQYTLDQHQSGVDREKQLAKKMKELSSKLGGTGQAINPAGFAEEAAEDGDATVRVAAKAEAQSGDPSITDKDGPGLFEKVAKRYESYRKVMIQ